MRPSRYNVTLPDEPAPGEALIFNSLSGALYVLEPAYRQALEALAAGRDPGPEDRQRLDELAAEGYVVADEASERDRLIHRLRTLGYGGGSVFRAIVVTTMACNLACRYCFETHLDRGKTLDPERAALVAEKIRQRVEATNARGVSIDFYGGEPLLNPQAIEQVAGELGPWCAQGGRSFSFTMTTNGTLLTREMVERLKPLGLVSARVSLDGVQQVHDSRRPYRVGEGSPFAAIVANLDQVADLLPLTLSVTYSGQDTQMFIALLDDLESRGLLRQLAGIQVGLEAVVLDKQGQACSLTSCAIDADSAKVFLELQQILHQRGLKLPKDLLAATNCSLTSEQGNWIFTAEGSIYKCPLLMGQPGYQTGSAEVETPLDIYYQLINAEPWRRCLEDTDCPYLPLCGPGAGCRLEALRNSGDLLGEACSRAFYDSYLAGAMRLELLRSKAEEGSASPGEAD